MTKDVSTLHHETWDYTVKFAAPVVEASISPTRHALNQETVGVSFRELGEVFDGLGHNVPEQAKYYTTSFAVTEYIYVKEDFLGAQRESHLHLQRYKSPAGWQIFSQLSFIYYFVYNLYIF